MSFMNCLTFSSLNSEGSGRLITLIGMSTVGASALANFEKLTCGVGSMLVVVVEAEREGEEERDSNDVARFGRGEELVSHEASEYSGH